MKRFFVIALLASGISLSGHAQFLIQRKSIAAIKGLEKSLQSVDEGVKKVHVSPNFIKGAKPDDLYNMLAFRHVNDEFDPTCVVQYFYGDRDSLVNATVYEWDVKNEMTNFKTQDFKFEQQLNRQSDYVNQYNKVLSKITELIGRPNQANPVSTVGDETSARSLWTLPSVVVNLSLDFTSKLKNIGDSKVGKFRVRLKIEYLK